MFLSDPHNHLDDDILILRETSQNWPMVRWKEHSYVFCILFFVTKILANHSNLDKLIVSPSSRNPVSNLSNWHSLLYGHCHHICMMLISLKYCQCQGTDTDTGTSRLTFCPFLSSGVAPRIGLSQTGAAYHLHHSTSFLQFEGLALPTKLADISSNQPKNWF